MFDVPFSDCDCGVGACSAMIMEVYNQMAVYNQNKNNKQQTTNENGAIKKQPRTWNMQAPAGHLNMDTADSSLSLHWIAGNCKVKLEPQIKTSSCNSWRSLCVND